MTAAIFGELTPDASTIMIVAEADEWEMEQTASRLKGLTPTLKSVKDEAGRWLGGFSIAATWPALVQLGWSFNAPPDFSWVPGPRLAEWAAAETLRRMMPAQPLERADWPAGKTPRHYQLASAAMIANLGQFLLLDDPGLGKTVTATIGVEERRRRGISIFPMVILVPSWEVGENWKNEILQWAPAWGMPRMHGGPNRVTAITPRTRRQYEHDVFITTYATARRDAADEKGALVRLRPAAVILDEVHWLRNAKAKQTSAAQRITRHAATFVGASGTPVTRSTKDLLPALQAMDHFSWTSGERFSDRFLASYTDGYQQRVTGLDAAREPEFRACLAGQMHRNAKADVLPELPDKIYSRREVEIPPEWRKAYDEMEEQWMAELPDGGGELPALDVLTRLTRLSQLASSAADVEMEMRWNEKLQLMVPHHIVTLRAPSWKAEAVMGVLAERPDQPTAVFAESRQLAMITGQDYCEKAGLRVGYVVGEGDGITGKTRRQAVADFQAGKLDVIVCTVGAGGTGITLTASNCAIMMQRPYQFDLAIQPEDRVHRIGSEKWAKVEIIDVITRNTVDARRRAALRDKAGQWGQLVRDPRIVKELLGGSRRGRGQEPGE